MKHEQDYYAFSDISNVRGGVFLFGPTPRHDTTTPSWRPEAIALLRESYNGPIFIPESEVWRDNYDGQVDWEWAGMDTARVAMFWVPRELKNMPALTTNCEYGYIARSSQLCVLGYPKEAVKMGYLHKLADRHSIPVAHTLEETVALTLECLSNAHANSR